MCAVTGDGRHVTEIGLARFESPNSVMYIGLVSTELAFVSVPCMPWHPLNWVSPNRLSQCGLAQDGCAMCCYCALLNIRLNRTQSCVLPSTTLQARNIQFGWISYLQGQNCDKIMGFKFCDTLKPHVGQMQDGRHPKNKISMSPIPVLELDFCVYCKVFNGEDRVSKWLQVMLSILRSFLKLSYTENIYHFFQSDLHYWYSMGIDIKFMHVSSFMLLSSNMVLSSVQHFK